MGIPSNGHTDELNDKYIKKIYKKTEKQNGPAKLLVWRTGMTALMVLDELYDIPFEMLESSLYFIGLDLNTKKLTRKFESILELATISADKFVDSLHRELNALSIFIKSENMLPELFEMISLCDKLRYKYHKDNAQVIHIMNAYQNVVLQSLEYLRPSKFDFSVAVCGCSTTGEILTVPEYYPCIDKISYEIQKIRWSGKKFTSMYELDMKISELAAMCGYPEIKSLEQMEYISSVDRLVTNQRVSLATYINEYTYDIVPKPEHAFNGNCKFLTYITVNGMDVDKIENMLKKRSRTLPSNGMLFKFGYRGGVTKYEVPEENRISEIFMKETYHNDRIVMLYSITANGNTLAGSYDTSCAFLSSLLLGSNSFEDVSAYYQNCRAILMYLYAAATSRETEQMLNEFTNLVYLAENKNGDKCMEITVTAYAQGGKPRNHYTSVATGVRINDERYEAVSRAIQGYIRKLPVGQSASEEAKERAASLGFDLADNETYVQPFVKNVLRLREKFDIE